MTAADLVLFWRVRHGGGLVACLPQEDGSVVLTGSDDDGNMISESFHDDDALDAAMEGLRH